MQIKKLYLNILIWKSKETNYLAILIWALYAQTLLMLQSSIKIKELCWNDIICLFTHFVYLSNDSFQDSQLQKTGHKTKAESACVVISVMYCRSRSLGFNPPYRRRCRHDTAVGNMVETFHSLTEDVCSVNGARRIKTINRRLLNQWGKTEDHMQSGCRP